MGREVGKLFAATYRIVLRDQAGNMIRDVATAEHHAVAVGAYEQAIGAYPDDVVCLQSGIRLLRRSDRQG